MIKNKKIILLHDYFLYKGGGERSMITLAKALNCDIATAFIAKDAFDPREYGLNVRELYKESRFSNLPGFRFLQVNLSFLFNTRFLKNYDIVIYSGDCLAAILNARGKFNVAYMHTPPRHLYDSYGDRMRSYGIIKKLIFIPYAFFSKLRFEWFVNKLDLIVTNSKTVQDRIKKYLHKDSVIAYPPGDAADFHWIGQKDFYLSWARLYDAKRVDKIVEAFTKMPDKKLVVASSGPELEKIQKIAEGHENIKVLGWVDDPTLIDLIGNCIATIYIPLREDFGMSPVESMFAGKPVIGVNEGGLRETIIDGKTGILIKPDFTIEDIVEAVKKLTPELAKTMRNDSEERAKYFSEDNFVKSFVEAVEKNMKDS